MDEILSGAYFTVALIKTIRNARVSISSQNGIRTYNVFTLFTNIAIPANANACNNGSNNMSYINNVRRPDDRGRDPNLDGQFFSFVAIRNERTVDDPDRTSFSTEIVRS